MKTLIKMAGITGGSVVLLVLIAYLFACSGLLHHRMNAGKAIVMMPSHASNLLAQNCLNRSHATIRAATADHGATAIPFGFVMFVLSNLVSFLFYYLKGLK